MGAMYSRTLMGLVNSGLFVVYFEIIVFSFEKIVTL